MQLCRMPPSLYRLILVMVSCLSAWAVNAMPFEDSMAQRTLACTACHGDQGRAGPDGYYPRIAGKPAAYLYKQLLNFREGRRHYGLMGGLIDTLPDEYLQDMARHFSTLSPPYPAPRPPQADADTLALGKKLATQGDSSRKIPACSQCHGQQLTGVEPDIPGLLGLPRDYLNAQLGGWKTGQRRAHAPDCMAAITRRMDNRDINAVAHWLAAQPLPANPKPRVREPTTVVSDKDLSCAPEMPMTAANIQAAPLTARAQEGAYLARLGNCQGCHTVAGGKPYAGGRPIDTPFGRVYAGNLTTDPTHGLGRWTADDFWRAMHEGRSRDGHALYPAFPYTSFTRITRNDSDALFAYLQTLPAVAQANRTHELRWPFNQSWALWAWRNLYFQPEPMAHDSSRTATWNRGAYLVRGLGHCADCHSPRNALGATLAARDLQGATLPGQGWYAPSLRSPREGGTAGRPAHELPQLLSTGFTATASASGPMAEVVQGSTQFLRGDDLRAMTVYLESLAEALPAMPTAAASSISPAQASGRAAGAKLYERHCASCHGSQGEGIANAYPALAGSRAVAKADSSILVRAVLYGGFGAATRSHPRPYGMPPFLLTLTDSEVADVLTHIRHSWGNAAAQITELDVRRVRKQP